MISIVNDFEVKEKIFIKKYSIHKKFKHTKINFIEMRSKPNRNFKRGITLNKI